MLARTHLHRKGMSVRKTTFRKALRVEILAPECNVSDSAVRKAALASDAVPMVFHYSHKHISRITPK